MVVRLAEAVLQLHAPARCRGSRAARRGSRRRRCAARRPPSRAPRARRARTARRTPCARHRSPESSIAGLCDSASVDRLDRDLLEIAIVEPEIRAIGDEQLRPLRARPRASAPSGSGPDATISQLAARPSPSLRPRLSVTVCVNPALPGLQAVEEAVERRARRRRRRDATAMPRTGIDRAARRSLRGESSFLPGGAGASTSRAAVGLQRPDEPGRSP